MWPVLGAGVSYLQERVKTGGESLAQLQSRSLVMDVAEIGDRKVRESLERGTKPLGCRALREERRRGAR